MIVSRFNEVIPSNKIRSVLSDIVAEELYLERNVVEKVINHQFKMVREATTRYAAVEIYRFAVLHITQGKLRIYIANIERCLIKSKEKYESVEKDDSILDKQKRLDDIKKEIEKEESDLEYMKSKWREPKVKKTRHGILKMKAKAPVYINITDDFNDLLDN